MIDHLAKAALATVVVGSALDAGLTLNALANGATESNPLMAWLLTQHHPAVFVGVKAALSALGGALLYQRRAHRWALWSLGLLADCYILLFFAHIYFGSIQ